VTETIGTSLYAARMGAWLLAVFGGLALLLAAIGIYGVLSFSIARRTREMGIRLALGAAPGAVRRLVVSEGVRLALIGLAAGLVLALVGTRALRSQLYGIGSADPATYLALSAVLLLVAVLATYLPARRATKVDPAITLRAE